MVRLSQETEASSEPCSSMTTSSNIPCYSYDVFLSFRGEDTRKTFTDHLYAALKQAGICTFRDDDAMDRGNLLEPELKKAIGESAVSIIVFSSDYASSKWCLDKVLMIIQEQERRSSKHEVVPVFYNVEPSDVRNQTGSFEKAFCGYEKKIEEETDHQKKNEWLEKVNAWRASLRNAGSLTGMVLADGYEGEFITKIVKVIKKKLNHKLLYVDDRLVGIENNIAVIESWLQDPSPDAAIICIHGMGGIGKTTISKCIYNSNYHDYDASCFLANIHETSSQHGGLLVLQKQLLSEILEEEVIWNLDEGIIKVRKALRSKKLLLVLDDITTREQLTALLGPNHELHRGSKVIITTRHKWLLSDFKVHPKVHVNKLHGNDSKKLFSLFAFGRDHPIEPYIVQSELVVHHCGGLPLALKVLGLSLKGKKIDVWEDAMSKLKAIPNPDIHNVLHLSFDTLEDTNDKNLFLHIACFFVGEDKDFIVKLLAECNLYPIVGIENLMDRSLLNIEDGKVMMHQLIKDMGREVVRQESPKDPGKRSRLWNHQDSYNVLKENEGTDLVEGLALDMQRIKGIHSTSIVSMDSGRKRNYEDFSGRTIHTNTKNFKFRAIAKMKSLMLLQLDYATFSGNYKKLPKKLRLLRWHGFPLRSIPNDVPVQKLVVLDLRYSKLKEVWDGFKVVGSLKILNLSYSRELIKTPNFGGLLRLESLLLEGCLSLTKVCESIRHLERLVLLDISDCRSLKNIPSLPRSLVSLNMYGCSSLGGPRQVDFLDSFSLFSFLVKLNVSKCNLFDSSFPEDWSYLFSLKHLNISNNHITSLPGCVETLPSLKILRASDCSHLRSILVVPKHLTSLFISKNMSLERIQLSSCRLLSLHACKCEKLQEVECRFQHESIKNVDGKVIRYLGLESMLENASEFVFDKQIAYTEVDSIKGLYEFAIVSTRVLEESLPCSWITDIRLKISFRVPSHPDGSRISGLNVCFRIAASKFYNELFCEINNKNKALVWKYKRGTRIACKKEGESNYIWLSLWRTCNLLDDGDEIVARIHLHSNNMTEESYVNFSYDYNIVEEDNQEKKDTYFMFNDNISWTDKLQVEVLDNDDIGKKYNLSVHVALVDCSSGNVSDSAMDWWGRKIDGERPLWMVLNMLHV